MRREFELTFHNYEAHRFADDRRVARRHFVGYGLIEPPMRIQLDKLFEKK